MSENPLPILRLLGSPQIQGPEPVQDFPTRRSMYLLARLAIAPRRRMTRRELASLLWPGEPYDTTAPRLRQELARLRKTLRSLSSLIGSEGDRVWLSLDGLQTDVEHFEHAIREAQAVPAMRERWLEEAIVISAQPFLEGVDEPWVVAERRRLGHIRYEALVALAESRLADRDHDRALALANQAAELIPSKEDAHLLAVRILRERGNVAEALRRYESLRLSLRAEPLAHDLRASSSPSYRLPRAAESIGREAEIARLLRWLEPSNEAVRVVSVLGPGGVGKTHLVAHACRLLSLEYHGFVGFVDLSDLSDTTRVPDAILSALGAEYAPTSDPFSRLVSLLPKRPFLLALDNLEQFGPSIAPMLSRLLSTLPQLRLFVTSRIALNMNEEYRLPLSPLPVPNESADPQQIAQSPSVRLFLAALEGTGWEGRIDASQLPAVAAIVRQLEGLPLGLHLAAPRLRTLGADGLLRRLENGVANLSTAAPGVAERHRSLRNAVEGSFGLLSLELHRAMLALSVFRGGWTLEAAALVGDVEDPDWVMDQLLDASLIERISGTEPPRFRMLETIREYAQSQVDEREGDQIRHRHLRWILELSQTVAGATVTEGLLGRYARLEGETENVYEALRFGMKQGIDIAMRIAGNLAFFWVYRTSHYEANRLLSDLLEQAADRPPTPAMLDAAFGQCFLCQFMGDEAAREAYDLVLRLGAALGDPKYEPSVLAMQASLAQNEMRYEDSERLFAKLDVLLQGREEDFAWGILLRSKGVVATYRGDFEQAIEYLRDAQNWYRTRGHVFYAARCRMNLARCAIEAPDLDLAEAVLHGLTDEVRRIRYDYLLPAVLFVQGRLDMERQRFVDALDRFETARAMWEKRGDRFQVSEQDYSIGRAHFALGHLSEAGHAFATAAAAWNEMERPAAAAVALVGAAAVLWRQGEPERAARVLDAAKRKFREVNARLIANQQRFLDEVGAEIFPSSGGALTIAESVALVMASLAVRTGTSS